ncbi:hypothetical protein [Aquisphaera giovannonii]|uniref:hypothetical protein n=1 Tax=Aquisphaera giovannonii TaxID=406548 RepID=UPI001AEF9669|nr:hypothetical protein [Aquisphaera giovannonii]
MRTLMAIVAIVAFALGLVLGIADLVRTRIQAEKYRRKAESAARHEKRSREIDAMDPKTRAREAALAIDDPYLDAPDWNRRMIPWYEKMKNKYDHAASNPREPIPPDDPPPL